MRQVLNDWIMQCESILQRDQLSRGLAKDGSNAANPSMVRVTLTKACCRLYLRMRRPEGMARPLQSQGPELLSFLSNHRDPGRLHDADSSEYPSVKASSPDWIAISGGSTHGAEFDTD